MRTYVVMMEVRGDGSNTDIAGTFATRWHEASSPEAAAKLAVADMRLEVIDQKIWRDFTVDVERISKLGPLRRLLAMQPDGFTFYQDD